MECCAPKSALATKAHIFTLFATCLCASSAAVVPTHGRAMAADQPTSCGVANEGEEMVFDCGGDLISAVDFASFGRPSGTCGADNLAINQACHYRQSVVALEDRCLGQATCIFTVTASAFGGYGCAGSGTKRLAAVLACGQPGSGDGAAGARRDGLGIGWQFNIFVFCVLALYCGMGIAYNVQRNGAKGAEALPHLAMWKDLPFLVRDGVIFAVDTIKSKGRPGYDGL